MSVNKERPHVVVIPEDDADRQLVVGFRRRFAVNDGVVEIQRPAGGWRSALDAFEREMVPYLRSRPHAHVILVVDFDEKDRRPQCEERIPEELRPRVFILGLADEPETAKRDLGISLERIGWDLAEDCRNAKFDVWGTPQFANNRDELERMIPIIKPFVFQGN